MLASEVRALARANRWPGSTRASAPGMVQCNVVALPGDDAAAFARWCRLNRSVAPVLAVTAPGDPSLPQLGQGIDIRHDLPAYRVMRAGGEPVEQDDIAELWGPDWQAFAFGCSFSLEDALRVGGVPLNYEARGFGGAIYRTTIETTPSGSWSGPLVVSMRPIPARAAEQAVAVSRRLPGLHGAPVHVGDPAAIGIELASPMEALGELSVAEDEVPVFWACGVTTHFVLENAQPALAATHVSSRMLVTDIGIDDPLTRSLHP